MFSFLNKFSKTPYKKERSKIQSYHGTKQYLQDLSKGHNIKIGYEIEKNSFTNKQGEQVKRYGNHVGYYNVFRGYEKDGSCGVEAITNILPLSSSPDQLKYVRDLLTEAERIINSPYDDDCGGHINISFEGCSGVQALKIIRGNLSILYSLYRDRLTNHYCRGNYKLEEEVSSMRGVVKAGEKVLEIRLPSAVVDVDDLMKFSM